MHTKEGLVKDLLETGAQYSLSKRRTSPTVKKYLTKDSKKFELDNVAEEINKTLEFIKELGANGKIILFVTSRVEAMAKMKGVAKELHLPYAVGRWIGGTISNFESIKLRKDKLLKLAENKSIGYGKQYTKKETLIIDRNLEKLEDMFGGLINLERRPDAVFVLDTKKNEITVDEARKFNIPIIGFSNSNANLNKIDYKIICNTLSSKTVDYILNKIKESYLNKT